MKPSDRASPRVAFFSKRIAPFQRHQHLAARRVVVDTDREQRIHLWFKIFWQIRRRTRTVRENKMGTKPKHDESNHSHHASRIEI